jgi:hypothetical protein
MFRKVCGRFSIYRIIISKDFKIESSKLFLRAKFNMKKIVSIKLFAAFLVVFVVVSSVYSQKRPIRKVVAPQAKPIIFALVNDGKSLEPIAEINKGKLVQTTGGDSEPKALMSFVNAYYKPNTTYRLIFGGASDGTITIKSANPKAECSKNMADASTKAVKGKIKGLVMALGTNELPAKNASGTRRFPTPAERSEIESLVRAEYAKQGVGENALKNLHYHNLTALDIDNDGKAEMVGSFWVENSPNERNLLFLIADKGSDGKYAFTYSEYKKVTPEEVMSGELKALDEGTYNELLLDVFDVDADGAAEIFTIVEGFEGNSFNVYSRQNGKWERSFESSNYHCAF